MQLLEVKNDRAKIIYNPEDYRLLPSDFLLIEDSNQKLACQILNLYASENTSKNIAEAKLVLSVDKDDKLSYYNGSIPSRNAKIMYLKADEITEMIAYSDNTMYLGNLTYHPKSLVKTPLSLIDDRLLVQCSREDNIKTILQNIVSELYLKKRKVVLFDFDGRYSRITNIPRITITENFKFPLNTDALDNILEYDTDGCTLEDKAVIQGIVLELRDYIKTSGIGFLALSMFKDAVVNEFASNPMSGLMLLRNKLWQYSQEGLFAENKEDFSSLNSTLQSENILIADVSKIDEKWHKFAVQAAAEIINQNCCFVFSINGLPMDRRSILTLYNNQYITPVIAASYDYPHRELLKSLCKNQILFKPSNPAAAQDEDCSALLNKINTDDFILCGAVSLDLALIVQLKPFDVKTSETIAEHELKRNVDRILYKSKSVLPKEVSAEEIQKNSAANMLTDEEKKTLDAALAKTENNENDGSLDKKPDEFKQAAGPGAADEIVTEEDLDYLDSILENQSEFNDETERKSAAAANEQAAPEKIANKKEKEDVKLNLDEYILDINDIYQSENSEEINQENKAEETDSVQHEKFNESLPGIVMIKDEVLENADAAGQENKTKETASEIKPVSNVMPASKQAAKLKKKTAASENAQKKEISAADKKYNTMKSLSAEEHETASETESDIEYIDDIPSVDERKARPLPPRNDFADTTKMPYVEETKRKRRKNESGESKTKNNKLKKKPLTAVFSEVLSSSADKAEAKPKKSKRAEKLEKPEKKFKNLGKKKQPAAANEDINSFEKTGAVKTAKAKKDESSKAVSEKIGALKQKAQNMQKNPHDKSLGLKNFAAALDVSARTSDAQKQKKAENTAAEISARPGAKTQQEGQRKADAVQKAQSIQSMQKQPVLAESSSRNKKKELTVYTPDLPQTGSSPAENQNKAAQLPFKTGDRVYHPKLGKGTVEGFSNYSNRMTFCHVQFDNIGRRILDPRISGLEKIQ